MRRPASAFSDQSAAALVAARSSVLDWSGRAKPDAEPDRSRSAPAPGPAARLRGDGSPVVDRGGMAAGMPACAIPADALAPAYRLSDLSLAPSGLARLRHGLAAKSRLRFARRLMEVGTEVAWAALMDRLRPLHAAVHRVEAGIAPSGRGSLGLYVHWSPNGRVSGMVLRQLAAWRAAGFDLVFVSNARPPAEDWHRVGEHCVLRVARDNVGFDFGAWRDGLAIALDRFGPMRELLLANDSVLGPLRPLSPMVAALRGGGDGLFGLTESRGGGPHLQSYLLLARGEEAVAEMSRHLADCIPSRSKWRVVQQGEIALTRRMLDRGHRVAALFGYDHVASGLGASDLAAFGPRYAEAGALARYPLNPTHHLWRVLIERFGFPFIKTELVRRNPGRLAGVDAWQDVVDAPARAMLAAHLAMMHEVAGASIRPF